ncbi:unnamed protein product [Prorocentrum cordatum]|uniref:sn-1-specific diacylglycerol lipase n=1 Tax=Prorocentrum cordatum TaxID=2364126 RepID=A0ABN9T369_9DINO|nr:unnamed protein product [Polarella glacialis]
MAARIAPIGLPLTRAAAAVAAAAATKRRRVTPAAAAAVHSGDVDAAHGPPGDEAGREGPPRWRVALERMPALSPAPIRGEAPAPEHAAPVRRIAAAALPVKEMMERFFAEALPETLPKVLAGLKLVASQDAAARPLQEQPGEIADPAMGELLEDALRCIRICKAAYGPKLLHELVRGRRPTTLFGGDPTRMMCTYAKLDPEHVRVVHVRSKATWLTPAHYVIHDTSRREAIVAIRGTLCVEDVVTDLGADEVDLFVGGKGHRSIFQSACGVLRSVVPSLEELADDVDTVTFTGHSLGGGVATYLTLLFLELLELEEGSEPQAGSAPEVRCFSFGSPGVCSLDTAQSLGLNMYTFSHGEDVVPRLSLGHVLELHARAVAAAGASRAGAGVNRAAQPEQASPRPPADARPPSDEWHRQPGDDWQRRKLYPAGQCFLIRANGSVTRLEPDDLARSGPCCRPGRREAAAAGPPAAELRAGVICSRFPV